MPHDPVAGLVVDLARRPLDRLEDDVLVEARDHSLGKLDPVRVQRVEVLPRERVLPGDDLVEALHADDSECGRELVHPVVEAGPRVVRLAVVAEAPCERRPDRRCRETSMPPSPVEIVLVAANDQIPASPQLPARLPFHAAPCAWAQSSSSTIPSARQNAAILLDVERDVAADVHEHRGVRSVLQRLALEVVERHAEVLAVAVDELDETAGRLDRERRRHERVGRAQHGAARESRRTRTRRGPRRSSSRSRRPAGRSTPSTLPRTGGSAARPTRSRRRAPRPRARAGARGRGGRIRWRTRFMSKGLKGGAARHATEDGCRPRANHITRRQT